MRGLSRWGAAAVAALFASSVITACAAENDESARKAQAVIERTKTARLTYALYVWNIITHPGAAPSEEWAAEFNDGPLHRVETPRNRILANCDTETGSNLSLETDVVDTQPGWARAACGINTNKRFVSKTWIGLVDTPFGKADRVRLVDDELIRTYDIAQDGAILRTVFAQRDGSETRVLLGVAVGYQQSLPDKAVFDPSSLTTSFVPDRFKAPPSTPLQPDWR